MIKTRFLGYASHNLKNNDALNQKTSNTCSTRLINYDYRSKS